jgi:hypothetical protein
MKHMLIPVFLLMLILGQPALFSQVQIDPDTAEGLLLERPAPVFSKIAALTRAPGGVVRFLVDVSEAGLVTKFYGDWAQSPLLKSEAFYVAMMSKYSPYAPNSKPVPFRTFIEIPVYPNISKKAYDLDREMMRQYFQEEAKCRDLMNASKWQQAEEVCKANLSIVKKLANYRAFQKMRAYQMVSISMLNRDKHKDALVYLNQALKFAKAVASESDPELAELLVMIGLTHSRMGNMGKARGFYEKGEKILQLAFDRPWSLDYKDRFVLQLKKALQYHISAAEADGAAKEAALLKTRLAGLP